MKKAVSLLLTLVTIINLFLLPVYAGNELETPEDDTIILELNNGLSVGAGFGIVDGGLAAVSVDYVGRPGYFFRVEVTIYLQKKVLGLFWTKVDIGTTNDEWFDASFASTGFFSHSHQLSSTGTYRAVIQVRFIGTGGPDDVLDYKPEDRYN